MTNRNLLVVDDDRDSADILGLLLRKHLSSTVVHVTYNADDAQVVAGDHHMDVAILDLDMPGTDGEELARILSNSKIENVLLLIAVSGNIPRLNALRNKKLFDHLLSKPVNVRELIALLPS